MAVENQADPLQRRMVARAIVGLSLITTVCALILSVGGGAPQRLPEVTLGSSALLRLERALVVGAATATVTIFAVRGWAGQFPSRISVGGAEYSSSHALADEAGDVTDSIREEIAHLTVRHERFAMAVGTRLAAVESELAACQTGQADMLLAVMLDQKAIDDFNELLAELEADKPRFRANMARIRASADRMKRFAAGDDEILLSRPGRKSVASPSRRA